MFINIYIIWNNEYKYIIGLCKLYFLLGKFIILLNDNGYKYLIKLPSHLKQVLVLKSINIIYILDRYTLLIDYYKLFINFRLLNYKINVMGIFYFVGLYFYRLLAKNI